MALEAEYPFSLTFSGMHQLQADGIIDTGNNLPDGIGDRLSIENGVLKAAVSSADDLTALGRRSEILHSPDSRAEYWYTWDSMIPDTWNDAYSMSIMQIHDTPDGGDAARHPGFLLLVENGQFVARMPASALPSEGTGGTRFPLISLVKNRWHSFCLHASWQIDDAGFREFFVDRVPYFRQWNLATHYDDVTGPYLKLGVYDFFSALSGSQTAYHRNVKIWSGNDGYESVMNGLPALKPNYLSL